MKKAIPFVFLILSFFAYSQELYLQWQNAFGTIEDDHILHIQN